MALFTTTVFLAVVLLHHIQHALLIGLSTQKVWRRCIAINGQWEGQGMSLCPKNI